MDLVFVTVIWTCASSSKTRESVTCVLDTFSFDLHLLSPNDILLTRVQTDQVIQIMTRILRAMKSSAIYDNVQPVLHAKVPIIRSRHRQFRIEIDISLHNMLVDVHCCLFAFFNSLSASLEAIENTRLLKMYTEIDSRVPQLGYMIKHLAKVRRIHYGQMVSATVWHACETLNNSRWKCQEKHWSNKASLHSEVYRNATYSNRKNGRRAPDGRSSTKQRFGCVLSDRCAADWHRDTLTASGHLLRSVVFQSMWQHVLIVSELIGTWVEKSSLVPFLGHSFHSIPSHSCFYRWSTRPCEQTAGIFLPFLLVN